ncbi:MAG: tetratricopeptide repeat protein [Paludibacteraceae bacterium]|nr:tetratricopeptide repeat protein [Paludibacteraceae bacterium]
MTKYKVQRRALLLLLIVFSISLSAQDFSADRELMNAYLTDDMPAWKAHIDAQRNDVQCTKDLLYEYGYCGYIVAEAKKEGKEALLPEAKQYVAQFRKHVEGQNGKLSPGHYEMYMSAVYVYELRLKESIHPLKAMSLAKDAVKKAPKDPLVLSYYGTCLFYAPKPFGDKKEALQLFLRAEEKFAGAEWKECWWRAAAMMYIAQCYDKKGDTSEAVRQCKKILKEYPDYAFIRDTYLPGLLERMH